MTSKLFSKTISVTEKTHQLLYTLKAKNTRKPFDTIIYEALEHYAKR